MTRKMRINDAGNEYIAHLESRLCASGTIRSRLTSIQQFRDVTGDIYLSDITPYHVDQWRARYGWGPSTMNTKLGNMRAFFKWARNRAYMPPDNDPLFGHTRSKVPTKEKHRIPQDKWNDLLENVPHPLERILIACGLYLMARSSELVNIKLKDVDLEAGEILIYRIKTKQHDRLPICMELDAELRRWLTWYLSRCETTPESYLLPNRQKNHTLRDPRTGRLKRLNPEAPLNPSEPIQRPHRNVQHVLRTLGYTLEGEGGHTLRRSAARAYFDELADDGYDGALRRVQSMLGHSSGMTTEIYLGLSLDKASRNKALSGKPMFKQREIPANVTYITREDRHG